MAGEPRVFRQRRQVDDASHKTAEKSAAGRHTGMGAVKHVQDPEHYTDESTTNDDVPAS